MANSSTATTGYVHHELYMWHTQGYICNLPGRIQPLRHWEDAETKRRMHNLLCVSGLADSLQLLKPRVATKEEICSVHSQKYYDRVVECSLDMSKGTHNIGDEMWLPAGGYEISALAVGGALTAVEAIMTGKVQNAYALVRPPGHHAEADQGMGFCVFNNIAIAAKYAQRAFGIRRVAIVDWDVHHGNGTQHAFEESSDVLFISLHQDNLYPQNSGRVTEIGKGAGEGFTINLPLPPGSGSGAYRAAFDRVVIPALDAFAPELILVSCGFDAAVFDPLSATMATSDDYRYMTCAIMSTATKHCAGRVLLLHEGGYSDIYVPFCGLAVMEQLSGVSSGTADPFLQEVSAYGYHELQPHQDAVIRQVEENGLKLLRSKLADL